MTHAQVTTLQDPENERKRLSRKKSIMIQFELNPGITYSMRKMASLKVFTEAQTQPRISELLTERIIKIVGTRTDQEMRSKVSVYQYQKPEERPDRKPENPSLQFTDAQIRELADVISYEFYHTTDDDWEVKSAIAAIKWFKQH